LTVPFPWLALPARPIGAGFGFFLTLIGVGAGAGFLWPTR